MMLNSATKAVFDWRHPLFLIIFLVANLQPWGLSYSPILLPGLIIISYRSHMPISMLWAIGLVSDCFIGTPLGFHPAMALLSMLIFSQLQQPSAFSLWGLTVALCTLALLLLEQLGFPYGVVGFVAALCVTGFSAGFALWIKP
jgi:hypothetical protein